MRGGGGCGWGTREEGVEVVGGAASWPHLLSPHLTTSPPLALNLTASCPQPHASCPQPHSPHPPASCPQPHHLSKPEHSNLLFWSSSGSINKVKQLLTATRGSWSSQRMKWVPSSLIVTRFGIFFIAY
uniref:Uncharacterized protein n=1 Tax=Fagus sylvatica TaxID=28930 RepID=A0A2N9H5S5_FAGSY